MCGFFTESHGTVTVIARAARKSSKRFASLEPMHQLRIAFELRSGSDTGALLEASIARTRLHLTGDLDRLEAAGQALRWLRKGAPPLTKDPLLWSTITSFLDDLDGDDALDPRAALANVGLYLLAQIGFALELERCVQCGRPCDPKSAALLDPRRGGLVCRADGGGPILLRPEQRARFIRGTLTAEDAPLAIEILEAAFDAHS